MCLKLPYLRKTDETHLKYKQDEISNQKVVDEYHNSVKLPVLTQKLLYCIYQIKSKTFTEKICLCIIVL